MTEISLSDKHKIKILLLWITTVGQASITLYLPSFPMIAHTFSASSLAIEQTITVFIIGFGFSPMIYGPLSDRYGRKPILLFSFFLICIGYIVNLLAENLHIFMIARLIQGLGCGGLLIGGRAIVRDIFTGRELASASSYLSMGFAIGFGISPIIGGYLSTHFNWKANFIFLLIFTLIIVIAISRYLPETLFQKEKYILFKKFVSTTLIDYRGILFHSLFLKFLLGGLFAYGVVIAYNVMTPFLMQNTFHLSAICYGYLALFVAIPYYLGASYNKSLVLKFGTVPIFYFGSSLIILAGFVMLIFSVTLKPNAFYVILPMMIATFGQSLIFSNTIASALQLFPAKLAGKASAIFSSLQMLIISILAAIMALLPNHSALAISIVIILLGMGCASLLRNIARD